MPVAHPVTPIRAPLVNRPLTRLRTAPFRFPQALDKGEGVVKDKLVLSGVGDTAFRQSLIEDQDLRASR
jgi:hypothetical protein